MIGNLNVDRQMTHFATVAHSGRLNTWSRNVLTSVFNEGLMDSNNCMPEGFKWL